MSLYAPLLESTYHLINKEALEKMKPTALLINTSRGGLVDAKALVDALKSGKLRGVALDVYEHEKKYFFNDFSQQVKFFRIKLLFLSVSRSFFFHLGNG